MTEGTFEAIAKGMMWILLFASLIITFAVLLGGEYNRDVSEFQDSRLQLQAINDTLESAETKIFEKVTSLSKEIASSDPDVTKFAELLVKIKFFQTLKLPINKLLNNLILM